MRLAAACYLFGGLLRTAHGASKPTPAPTCAALPRTRESSIAARGLAGSFGSEQLPSPSSAIEELCPLVVWSFA